MTRQKSPKQIGMKYMPSPIQKEALDLAGEAYQNLIKARYAYKRSVQTALQANCSQKDIAEAVGVRSSTISKIITSGIQEAGHRPEEWREWDVREA